MEGRPPAYYTSSAKTTVYRTGDLDLADNCVNWNSGYRLPRDTEWEYAARGGVSSKRFPWGGNTISHSQANYYAVNYSDYDLSGDGYHPTYATGGYPYTSCGRARFAPEDGQEFAAVGQERATEVHG